MGSCSRGALEVVSKEFVLKEAGRGLRDTVARSDHPNEVHTN